MTNTRITYAGAGNDRYEASVLAGDLGVPHVRRLELGAEYGKLTELVDELGLARLAHNGNGIRLENIVPTLEPATNARANAASFYARVIPVFARQTAQGLLSRSGIATDGEKLITDRLKGNRGAGDLLSTRKGLLALQSDQAFVAGWLRSMLSEPITAAAILSPLNFEIPPQGTLGRRMDPHWGIGNVHAIYLFQIGWATMMGNHEAGPNLLNAMTPDAQVTVNQAQAALNAAKIFINTVNTAVSRLPA